MSQSKKKCPHCKKFRKLHDVNMKKAYELGRLDAENELKHTINIMKITHRRLYDELSRLDRYNPLSESPTTIKINLDDLQKLILFLRKNHYSKACNLQRYIKAQIGGNGSKSKRNLRKSLSS